MLPRDNYEVALRKGGSRNLLWDPIFSFHFMKNGPVRHMLNKITEEALKLLSLSFREFEQLCWNTSFHSARIIQKQNGLFQRTSGLSKL